MQRVLQGKSTEKEPMKALFFMRTKQTTQHKDSIMCYTIYRYATVQKIVGDGVLLDNKAAIMVLMFVTATAITLGGAVSELSNGLREQNKMLEKTQDAMNEMTQSVDNIKQKVDKVEKDINGLSIEQSKLRESVQQNEQEIRKTISSRSSGIRSSYSNDLKEKSGLSVEQLEKGLSESMKPYAKYFIQAEQDYGVNAILLAAISAEESAHMKSNMAKTKNNVFGFGKMKFTSIATCIDYVANFLNDEYLTPSGKHYNGTSLRSVNKRYCLDASGNTDYQWSQNVATIAKAIHKKATM